MRNGCAEPTLTEPDKRLWIGYRDDALGTSRSEGSHYGATICALDPLAPGTNRERSQRSLEGRSSSTNRRFPAGSQENESHQLINRSARIPALAARGIMNDNGCSLSETEDKHNTNFARLRI